MTRAPYPFGFATSLKEIHFPARVGLIWLPANTNPLNTGLTTLTVKLVGADPRLYGALASGIKVIDNDHPKGPFGNPKGLYYVGPSVFDHGFGGVVVTSDMFLAFRLPGKQATVSVTYVCNSGGVVFLAAGIFNRLNLSTVKCSFPKTNPHGSPIDYDIYEKISFAGGAWADGAIGGGIAGVPFILNSKGKEALTPGGQPDVRANAGLVAWGTLPQTYQSTIGKNTVQFLVQQKQVIVTPAS